METEDIPPTTLKPAPVIVASEIVTVAVPVFVSDRVWESLEPIDTFPKARLAALPASDPEVALTLELAAGAPALGSPTQLDSDEVASKVKRMPNNLNSVR